MSFFGAVFGFFDLFSDELEAFQENSGCFLDRLSSLPNEEHLRNPRLFLVI